MTESVRVMDDLRAETSSLSDKTEITETQGQSAPHHGSMSVVACRAATAVRLPLPLLTEGRNLSPVVAVRATRREFTHRFRIPKVAA